METSTSESVRLRIHYHIMGQKETLDHRNVLGVFLIFILMRLNEVCPPLISSPLTCQSFNSTVDQWGGDGPFHLPQG